MTKGIVMTLVIILLLLLVVWVLIRIASSVQEARDRTASTSAITPAVKGGSGLLYLAIFLFYSILASVGYWMTVDGGIKWWIVAYAAMLCHLAAGAKIVGEQEHGVLVLWGRIIAPLESGPHFAPWPFRIRRVTKNSVAVDFGTIGEDDLERYRRSETSPSWYVMPEPIRINWGDIDSTPMKPGKKTQYEESPFAQHLTTDPHLYFIIRVSDPIRLILESGGLQEAMERIQDTCISALSEIAGKTFVAKAMKELQTINRILRRRVEDLVVDPEAVSKRGGNPDKSWGIDVIEVRVKNLGTPRRTNEAIADSAAMIAKSDGEARSTIRNAAATRKRLEEEGAGKAKAKVLEADAEEKRLTKEGSGRASAAAALAKVAESPSGELVMKLDALSAGLKHGKAVILPADMSLMTGLLSAQAALESTKEAPKPSVPPKP